MGKTIKAVIFDMDGVIADSQPLHAGLEELLLKEHGIEIPAAELTRKYAGVPDRDCAEIIFKEHGKEVDLDKFVKEKWTRLIDFAKSKIAPIDGVFGLIDQLKKDNFLLAVASSSRPEFIELVLSELGIKDSFETIINGQEVKFGKPAPDIFLLAAQRLEVPPSTCWVIEDARHGVIAAKRAGMKCVWLTNDDDFGEQAYSPDIKIKSLIELKASDFI
ncbi:MAG: HAD family phosphatase [Candidatus Nealsonbacteria bacterium]|nr:HAD family phosphatase [Candidatus Nealsonbacteria bacterium]